MKRFFSVILSGVFIFSTVTPCFANASTDNIDLVDKMVSCGVSKIVNESVETPGVEIYTIETAGVLAKVKKESVSNGMLYTVQEGNINK